MLCWEPEYAMTAEKPVVVALVTDLLFSSRIEAVLRRAGYAVVVVDSLGALDAGLDAAPAAAVVLDLHAGFGAEEAVAHCRPRGVPVLAFGRHTEPALLRSARLAGCDEVVPRSTFVEEMAALVAKACARRQVS